jgi:hypothetical protein
VISDAKQAKSEGGIVGNIATDAALMTEESGVCQVRQYVHKNPAGSPHPKEISKMKSPPNMLLKTKWL